MKKPAFLLAASAVIVLAGLAVYSPALRVGFYLDDFPSIVNNHVVTNPSGLKEIWEFWPTRFLVYLSLAVNYRLSGLNPASYHAFNIAVHLAAGLLVFALLSGLFSLSRPAAAAGALFFVLHPAQTQAVTYVIQRAASLGAFFYLAAVFLYFKSLPSPSPAVPASRRRRGLYLLSLLSACAAFLSKEYTFTLPFVLLLLQSLFFVPSPEGKRPRRALIPFFILVLIIPALTFLYRQNPYYDDSGQLQYLREGGLLELQAPKGSVPPLVYLRTQPRVALTYLRLVFYPVAQLLDYDYPFFSSFLRPEVIASLAVVAALLIWAVRAGRKAPALSAGVFWFFVTLLPESSAIPIRDALAEHRLYLPLFAAAVLSGLFVQRFLSSRRWPSGIAAVSLVCLAALTFSRNRAWLDPLSFWETNAAHAPGKARVLGNLGKAYLQALTMGETDSPEQMKDYVRRARRAFERVVEIEPDHFGALNNLAVINIDYYRDYPRAKEYLQAVLELSPDYPSAHLNLGVIHLNSGELEPAIANFLKVIELDPTNPMAFLNLSACYINLGRLEKAEEWLRRGIAVWPEAPVFYDRMVLLYQRRGEEDQAADYARRAAALRRRHALK